MSAALVGAPRAARTRRPRLGLRTRVSIVFGGLALALSLVLAGVAWTLITRYLMSEEESATLAGAVANVRVLDDALSTGRGVTPQLLANLPAEAPTSSILTYDGQWYATSLTFGPRILPVALRDRAIEGAPVEQRVTIAGTPYLVIGLPMGDDGDAYFGLFSLADLDGTYRVLSTTLAAAAIATALLGLGLGRSASRRALAPLTDLTNAAAAAARGNLDVRLPVERDPDLAVLAESFNETADALQRRVIADARFAGDVSHELRTPLTTLLNAIQLLENQREQLPPSSREAVDLLAGELTRFHRMVLDLIEISRDDSGDDPRSRERVVVADLVRFAADAAAGKPVTRVDPEAADLVIDADKRRLEQVVRNLVLNAQQHGRGCAEVSVEPAAAGVRILVDDCGPGVPEPMRERIFERFSRPLERERESDSTGVGLGLAIVERHVRFHGGSVHVEDRPGGGARFVVELPVVYA
jgi:signal transduction histidine kinase